MASSPDLIVMGGGPAGLAAAIAARRRGLDVLVRDPACPPIERACGEGLLPDSIAAARELGVDLGGRGRTLRGIRFLDAASGAAVAADFPSVRGVGLRRTVLHEALRQAASDSGVRMEWGAPVELLDRLGARWIVGADGAQSAVRAWAGLDRDRRHTRRYAFRRHYRVEPWSDHVEVYWSAGAQLYCTPVGDGEVGVVVISRDPRLRIDGAMGRFPAVERHLRGRECGPEAGRVTAMWSLRAVARGNVALVGDASGSVDAITGEGIGLAFRQALALARALAADDLESYEAEHRRIARRPSLMADALLLLDRRPSLRRIALSTFAASPWIFRRLLAWHVAGPPVQRFAEKNARRSSTHSGASTPSTISTR